MPRILIADDHAIIRTGIKEILLGEFPFAQIEEASDGEELLKKVIKDKWDVVITDVSMPGRGGVYALEQIRQVYPNLPVLVLTMYPEDQYALRVFKAGASGYLTKDTIPSELTR